jgi:hypothetical protein
MTSRLSLSVLILALTVPNAWADAFRAPPLKAGAAVSIQGYARQNPGCAEWTDGCVVCATTGGRARCSTPGIACTPAGLTCKRRATP